MSTTQHHTTTPSRQAASQSGSPTRLTTPRPAGFVDEPGLNHWDEELERCGRCDSRYCHTACLAGAFDHFYVTGKGWLPRTLAAAHAARWQRAGLDWGPHHGLRRIEMVCDNPDCRRCQEPVLPTVHLRDLDAGSASPVLQGRVSDRPSAAPPCRY